MSFTKKELLELLEKERKAVETPYYICSFNQLLGGGKNFGQLDCGENTMDFILSSANLSKNLVESVIGLSDALNIALIESKEHPEDVIVAAKQALEKWGVRED